MLKIAQDVQETIHDMVDEVACDMGGVMELARGMGISLVQQAMRVGSTTAEKVQALGEEGAALLFAGSGSNVVYDYCEFEDEETPLYV